MRSARDEIVDAAVHCFARDGFGASLRTVALEAGVSAALIVHHFGSKQGLIEACDARVLGVADEKQRLFSAGGIAAAAAWVMQVMQEGSVPAYISRALVDGGDAGKALFNSFVDVTEKALLDLDLPDHRMIAALLVSHSLGTMVLRDHIAAATGVEPFGAEGFARHAVAAIAVYDGALRVLLHGEE